MNEENNIHNLINKIDDLIKILKEKNYEIRILKSKDVAKILNINQNQACMFLKREDVPSLKNVGDLKIEEHALFNFLQFNKSL